MVGQDPSTRGLPDGRDQAEGLTRLVEAARRGESEALGELFDRYRQRVLRFCLTFPALGEADACDLTQEVFVRAFRGIHRLEDPGKFEGWLFAIARNRCLTLLRKARRERLQGEQLAREAASAEVPGAQERRLHEREAAIVAEEIGRLPESSQKQAGRLFYQEGRDTKAIADALGAPVSTVTTWLSRFRVRIRKRLVLRILALRGSRTE